jgi:choice-of-anchor A domain-containing protein
MSPASTRRLRARLRPLASVLFFAAAGAATAFAVPTTPNPTLDVDDVATSFEDYNLISFGNANFTQWGDTQGSLAINGNLTLSGSGSIGNNPIVSSNNAWNSNPSLYVTGQLALGGGTTTSLNSGYAALTGLTASNWTWNSSNKSITNNSNGGVLSSSNAGTTQAANTPYTIPSSPGHPKVAGNAGPAGWNWTTLQQNLVNYSADLANAGTADAAAGTLGTISVGNGQQLQFIAPIGQTSGVVVFDLTVGSQAGAGVLSGGNNYGGQNFSQVKIDVPAGLTYVINVINAAGGSNFGSNVNFNADSNANDNQLLWNITGSGTVSIDNGGYFYGSILAPNTTIDTTTVIDGQVAANGFSDTGVELHADEFSPAAVATPEPATYALWAAGICAAAIAFRRFQKSRPQPTT